MEYELKRGDNLEKLAQGFKISLFSLKISNSEIMSSKRVRSGVTLKIPEAGPDIVDPSSYTHDKMLNDMVTLKERFPFIDMATAGKTVLGKIIPALRIGKGHQTILCNGSHHAREWITTPLLMKFAETYCSHLISGEPLFDYNLQNLYLKSTIWLVPMVNPDGVNLCIKGISEDNLYYSDIIDINNGSTDFSLWKANIRGVDLNRNYYAGWEKYKSLEPSLDITGPSAEGFSGLHPESEPETHGLANFTRLAQPRMVLAFHAKGEEIFWDYDGKAPPESENIAKALAEVSGYAPKEPDVPGALYAGYKDWFIKEFKLPGFTIEVGRDTTPVPLSQFDEICEKGMKIILRAVDF